MKALPLWAEVDDVADRDPTVDEEPSDAMYSPCEQAASDRGRHDRDGQRWAGELPESMRLRVWSAIAVRWPLDDFIDFVAWVENLPADVSVAMRRQLLRDRTAEPCDQRPDLDVSGISLLPAYADRDRTTLLTDRLARSDLDAAIRWRNGMESLSDRHGRSSVSSTPGAEPTSPLPVRRSWPGPIEPPVTS